MKNTKKKREVILLMLNLLLAIAIVVVCSLIALRSLREKRMMHLANTRTPDWIREDFLIENPYSRAGEPLTQVRDIVVHYVANPGKSAKQNWSYFNGLADQTEEPKKSASSHFIIGLDGEILQCMPLNEVAYTNYPRNYDTITIECCHPDETGKFTEETLDSLIRLTAWLLDELKLSEKNVIRHYDVSGKECPKYYVDHEDEWEKLRNEIKRYRK